MEWRGRGKYFWSIRSSTSRASMVVVYNKLEDICCCSCSASMDAFARGVQFGDNMWNISINNGRDSFQLFVGVFGTCLVWYLLVLPSETHAVASMTSCRAVDGGTSYHSCESLLLSQYLIIAGIEFWIERVVHHTKTASIRQRYDTIRPNRSSSQIWKKLNLHQIFTIQSIVQKS